MKNHYFNRGFIKGKGKPFDHFDLEVFSMFDSSLMNIYIYIMIIFTENKFGLF